MTSALNIVQDQYAIRIFLVVCFKIQGLLSLRHKPYYRKTSLRLEKAELDAWIIVATRNWTCVEISLTFYSDHTVLNPYPVPSRDITMIFHIVLRKGVLGSLQYIKFDQTSHRISCVSSHFSFFLKFYTVHGCDYDLAGVNSELVLQLKWAPVRISQDCGLGHI